MIAGGGVWSSSARYTAGHDGKVDLATTAPTSGSYHGKSAMGPFWSATYQHPTSDQENRISTKLTASTGDGHASSVTVTQRFRSAGVTAHSETLAGPGFVGEFFTPAHHRHDGPAVITWGGSEGGDAATVPEAVLLASHGIPALAIAYFDEPGLPCSLSNIPLEYFVKAIRWLKDRRGIDPDRVWGWSVSRGSEALGLIATHWPHLLHGLVDESASSVVNESYPGQCPTTAVSSWTLRGRAVPYDTAFGAESLLPGKARPATIPFSRYRGPVLLVSGAEDEIWPSDRYENIIMRELRADPATHIHLNYAHAGHSDLGQPYTPIQLQIDDHGRVLSLGGTAAGYEQAREHDWPALLHFLTTH